MSEQEEKKKKEENQTQIYPDDIQIIHNSNQWRPSRQEIQIYAVKIGYEPTYHPKEFLEIAEKNLMKTLPNKWRRAFGDNGREMMYIDLVTNEIHIFTDIE